MAATLPPCCLEAAEGKRQMSATKGTLILSQIPQRRLWSNQEETRARGSQGCLGIWNGRSLLWKQDGREAEQGAGWGLDAEGRGGVALRDFRAVKTGPKRPWNSVLRSQSIFRYCYKNTLKLVA